MSLRLSNSQLELVVAGCVQLLDDPESDVLELEVLLERFQEMCIHRKLPEALKQAQDALMTLKRPLLATEAPPLLLRGPPAQ